MRSRTEVSPDAAAPSGGLPVPENDAGIPTPAHDDAPGSARVSVDPDSFATLYIEHLSSALGYATMLVGRQEAEDLVAEAFTRLWRRARAGTLTIEVFGAYLRQVLQHAAIDRARSAHPVVASSDLLADLATTGYAPLIVGDRNDEHAEAAVLHAALAQLPPRWREVLWRIEVEGYRPVDLAPDWGIGANAISSAATRARERLRETYVMAHLGEATTPRCSRAVRLFILHCRGRLSDRRLVELSGHLTTCPDCESRLAEVAAVANALPGAQSPGVALGALANRSDHRDDSPAPLEPRGGSPRPAAAQREAFALHRGTRSPRLGPAVS